MNHFNFIGMFIVVLWLGLCFLVSFLGSEKKIGYWGTFLVSLIFSPIIGVIAALVSGSNAGNINGSKNFILARKCRTKGEIPNAIKYMNQSLNINPTYPLSHYYLATYHSLSQNKEYSFRSLQKSFENGFSDFDKLKNDPDLEWLRTQEEFEQFVSNGYKQNNNLESKSTSFLTDLKELGELREKNVITEDEFNAQKAKILGSQ